MAQRRCNPRRALGARLVTVLGISLVGFAALAPVGCGGTPTYVRGEDVQGFDDQTMGTTFDKRDLDKLMHENLSKFVESSTAKGWANASEKPIFAIYPMTNETSEHIGSQIDALMSDIETFMVGTQLVRVVSLERQHQLIAQIEEQHGGGFDPAHVAEYNKQLGAQFYMTGKVFSSDQRADEERRVQYFMFMQVIDVSTGEIVWQNKAAVTKGIANL
ncbi:MAG TPA: penicillin-binding protein activator LpoB [Polyangiaceae bacterium]|jgi:uncharacterized protein (TIGR02722 family)|nr:penicillin-binding protein activator LpoB [Polyangiaceae bacterium]